MGDSWGRARRSSGAGRWWRARRKKSVAPRDRRGRVRRRYGAGRWRARQRKSGAAPHRAVYAKLARLLELRALTVTPLETAIFEMKKKLMNASRREIQRSPSSTPFVCSVLKVGGMWGYV